MTISPEEEAQIKAFAAAGISAEPNVSGIQNNDIDLELILDVPVEMTIEIGRTCMPIRNLLQIGVGSVVETTSMIGEPLNIYVNGTFLAKGEVVTVGDKLGIRFIEIVSPAERIRQVSEASMR